LSKIDIDKVKIANFKKKRIALKKLEKIMLSITILMFSFLASKTVFMENFPIGISMVASIPSGTNLIYAFLGSFIGYLTAPKTSITIRYISTLITICLIRWTFYNFKKIKQHTIYIIFITFIPNFMTGLALKFAEGFNFRSFTECVLESVVASGFAYVLQAGFKSNLKINFTKLTSITVIFFTMVASIIILPFIGFKIFSINFLNPIFTFLVLIFAYYFEGLGGSISGIVQGFLYLISQPSSTISIICTPLSGMVAGLFSKLGKTFISLSYIFSNLIIHFHLNSKISSYEIIEKIIGIILFMIFAEKLNLKNLINFASHEKSEGTHSLAIQNLSFISSSFDASKKIISEVSNKLDKNFKSDSKILVHKHFENVSQICLDLIKKIENDLIVDEELSLAIKKIIKEILKVDSKVSCVRNNLKKFLIQIEFSSYDFPKNLESIEEEIAFVCKRSFMKPEIFLKTDSVLVRFCEKTNFRPRIYTSQHSYKESKYCGDNFKYFFDGLGKFYVILSDGMGTGISAAIDSTTSTEIMSHMLKSGIDIKSAVSIANSSLMVKSSGESLATLDILVLDLFEGRAEFIKAGAATTFLKIDNKVVKVLSNTLPIGIFPNIDIFKSIYKISEGDTILMVSDGVSDTGEEWVESELKKNQFTSNLAENILKISKAKRFETNDDDISVISINIVK